jgi:hypothetical protein
MAKLLIFSIILLILFSLASCKSKQPVVTNYDTISERIVEVDKLTPVAIPGEQLSLNALFECDSLNRVLLVNYNELKSKNMNSFFSFANGSLEFNAETEPDTLFVKTTDRWYNINTKTKTTITITKEVPVPVNKFGFLDWIGLIALVAGAALMAINLLIKPYLKYINSLNK